MKPLRFLQATLTRGLADPPPPERSDDFFSLCTHNAIYMYLCDKVRIVKQTILAPLVPLPLGLPNPIPSKFKYFSL